MKNKFWSAHPLLKVLTPLVIGVLLSYFIKLEDRNLILILLIITCLVFGISHIFKIKNVKYRWISGFIAFASFLTFGFSAYQLEQMSRIPKVPISKAKKESFVIKVLDEPTLSTNSIKTVGRIIEHSNPQFINKKLLVYFEKELNDGIAPGDLVFALQYINEINSPSNPHEFDFKTFMSKQQVYYQSYLGVGTTKEIFVLNERQSYIVKLRRRGYNFIEREISPENQGIAKAVLFGAKNSLSHQHKLEFSRAGTMHILAVSGLHVGIIFILVRFLIQFIERLFSLSPIVKVIILISVIWIFVFLTGAKASVLRAGIMFSIFAFGSLRNSKLFSLNSLALAAILLIVLRPSNIFDVSFQLSFSAVSGILIFVPFFQNTFIQPRWKIAKYLLDITYVSFAAQMSTLPFTLFYFQQYPTFGLVSNLIAIPLAFLIVATGFFGFLFSFLSPISKLFGFLLEWELIALQSLNEFVSSLGFSVIENISLHKNEFFISLFLLSFLMLMIKQQNKKWLYPTLVLFLLLTASVSWNKWKVSTENELTVYSLRNNIVAEYRTGRTVHVISKNQISDDTFRFSIQPNWKNNFINKKKFYTWENQISTKLFRIEDETVFLSDYTLSLNSNTTSDIAIITKPDYKSYRNILEESKDRIFLLADSYPNRILPDSLENLHFFNTEGYYQRGMTIE